MLPAVPPVDSSEDFIRLWMEAPPFSLPLDLRFVLPEELSRPDHFEALEEVIPLLGQRFSSSQDAVQLLVAGPRLFVEELFVAAPEKQSELLQAASLKVP